jgi:signal transduction histidine kinase
MRQLAHDLASLQTVVGGSLDRMDTELKRMRQAYQRELQIITEARRTAEAEENARQFDLNAIVIDVADLLQAELCASHVRLDLRLSAEPLPIAGESLLIFRALLNLCMNARNAMAHGGSLRITTETAGAHSVLLHVTDSGTGMTPEFLERIWNGEVSDDGQHGHGLQIVRDRVATLGGQITVQSQPFAGTTFSIMLPLAGARQYLSDSRLGTKAA